MQVRLQNKTGRRVTDGELVRLFPGSTTAFIVAQLSEFGIIGTVSGTIESGQVGYINLINTVDYSRLLGVPTTFPPSDHTHTFADIDTDVDEDIDLPHFGDANNYTEFDNTGHQIMAGNARPWRDELGDALGLQKNGVGITTDIAELTQNFDFNAAFNATPALADFLYKNVQLNHDKDLSATLYPHIHWFQAKNYSPNFLLEYRWQKNNGIKVTSWTKLKCNNLAFAYTLGTTLHQISYSAGIAVPVGTTLSDIVQFRIYRDTTDASGVFLASCPYNTGGNASAPVLSFDCHFMTNSLGSTEELIK